MFADIMEQSRQLDKFLMRLFPENCIMKSENSVQKPITFIIRGSQSVK